MFELRIDGVLFPGSIFNVGLVELLNLTGVVLHCEVTDLEVEDASIVAKIVNLLLTPIPGNLALICLSHLRLHGLFKHEDVLVEPGPLHKDPLLPQPLNISHHDQT